MSGMFGGKKKEPDPVPIGPTEEELAAQKSAKFKEEEDLRKRKGRASTILNTTTTAATVGKKTLMGE